MDHAGLPSLFVVGMATDAEKPRMNTGRTLWLIFCVLLAILLWRLDDPLYIIIAALPDGIHRHVPFEDLSAILRAGLCWRHGVNVYAPSSCLAGGVYNYSPFLLRAAYLPINAQDFLALGFCAAGGFIIAQAFIPAPLSSRGQKFAAAMTLSPPVFYALEQANFDLVIFVAVCAGLRILQRHPAIGFGLFTLAAGAKFYPVALFSLILRERLQKFLGVMMVLSAGILVFLFCFAPGTTAAIAIIPISQPFRATFGAVDLPLGIKLLHLSLDHIPSIKPYYPFSSISASQPDLRAVSAVFSLLATMSGIIIAPRYRTALSDLPVTEKNFLWAGLCLIIFCFFVTQNVAYRSIFLLLAVPGLWGIAGSQRQYALALAVLALMWEAVPRQFCTFLAPWIGPLPAVFFWLLREFLWWWVIIQFTSILWCCADVELRRLRREAESLRIQKLTNT
jgi:hypothetical protein